MTEANLCIIGLADSKHEVSQQFATVNNLQWYAEKNTAFPLQLCYHGDYIELFDTDLNTGIHVDFEAGALAHRKNFGGGRGQAVAKAMGLKHGATPSILDITAGLARDAFVLRTLGCTITLIEKSPILASLIRDGIARALANDPANTLLAQNFELIENNSLDYMAHCSDVPDVIYIDPMYPDRKKSALVKKDMQILHRLLGADDNAEALLEKALNFAKYRVVVKRPDYAEPVAGIKPSTSISSKNTRYDIYSIKKLA